MTREESKYCEECKHCAEIHYDTIHYRTYIVDCDEGLMNHKLISNPIIYCARKKIRKKKEIKGEN